MTGESEAQSSRSYHSPRRVAAARATRARIREAARERFLADGFAGTSVRSIAAAAGVAEKTVYLQFPTKLDLLIKEIESRQVSFKHWATPGATKGSATLDGMRVACRRAERATCAMREAGFPVSDAIVHYLNRLSDLAWLYARFVETKAGVA